MTEHRSLRAMGATQNQWPRVLRRLLRPLAAVSLLALTLAAPLRAQGFLHRLKQAAAQKVTDRIDQRTDEALDSLINGSEHVIKCLVTDHNCIDKVHAAGKQVQYVDASGKPVANQPDLQGTTAASATTDSAGAGTDATSAPPGAGAWLNYDFIPGDKTLFYDDFANDHVGDLPTHEDLTDGNATIVAIKGQKYFRTTTGATFYVNLPDTLPDRFTLEVTYFQDPGGVHPMNIYIGSDSDNPMDVFCYHDDGGIDGSGANGQKHSEQKATGIGDDAFVHCRYTFDKGYVKAYINAQRVAQLNGLVFTRTTKVQFEVPGGPDDAHATLLTDIRIAAGGKPLYDALTQSGRVATHGILFASGSAVIRGESTPTLKEIGDMLAQHADLKLLIEGHTDNVGAATANQTLSEQRAAAVKTYLVANFHIDASRLTTKGYGDTKPIDSNATAEGRQNNRRVELVKQ